MPDIPIHKVIQQSDLGIFAKDISRRSEQRAVEYAHRDNYYIFGLVESGICRVSIDFNDYFLSESQIICTQPSQVHRIAEIGNAKGFLLFIDGVFLEAPIKHILAEYALSPTPIRVDDNQCRELTQLFFMIIHRMEYRDDDNELKCVLQNLACSVVGIITDSIQKNISQMPKSRRHVEIALRFKELLSKDIPIDRKVSHYAESLHLSAVYLNEVIKDTTGVSVSVYIQNELVQRAKQLLMYTHLSVKEIALNLGVDNYAYFTRLFTKVAGINPTAFRKKNLD